MGSRLDFAAARDRRSCRQFHHGLDGQPETLAQRERDVRGCTRLVRAVDAHHHRRRQLSFCERAAEQHRARRLVEQRRRHASDCDAGAAAHAVRPDCDQGWLLLAEKPAQRGEQRTTYEAGFHVRTESLCSVEFLAEVPPELGLERPRRPAPVYGDIGIENSDRCHANIRRREEQKQAERVQALRGVIDAAKRSTEHPLALRAQILSGGYHSQSPSAFGAVGRLPAA